MSEVLTRPDPASQIGGLIFAVLLVDPDLRIAESNHAAENLIGHSSSRLAGRPLGEVLELLDERVLDRLSEPDAAIVARDIMLRVAGQERRVNVTVSPLSAHPGWRVITLSDAGRGDEGQEKEQDIALGAPSILAHEIKNPLSAIRGAGQLVERKLGPEDRALARMITDEVDRIARLIDRMQALGSTTPEPVAPCNPHEAIRAAIATVRAAGKENVEIREEFDPSLPPVLASRDALEQVLINLISNARDAALDGAEPRIVVSTRFVSGHVFRAIRLGQSVQLPVEITITDNGPGVEPSLRDHIFEPFVTSKKSGQGLGLALVRKLVRDMAGRISHQRDSREGLTHFRIHLPLASEGECK
ncbi:ATP-binding protein [Altererythrobacter arenosus]|uniref:histidine kinase n=1 Tax=Altererythrobacter arenosus TaxID=3032592 RepID=A0ABY8FUJ8_9SPHN|nr:ATP-binding protein [Altererythrobacter sp. CAU 1644]WFL77086.1 ATP-binding protein [Altererythrobacter sp. CAU 1644]